MNLLDDELMGYFDNNINIFVSKQSWMEKLGQDWEERQTNIARANVQRNKVSLSNNMKRFNQSDGNTNLKPVFIDTHCSMSVYINILYYI